MSKTKVFNLIILDESGSMSCVHQQTISNCNETIQSIRGTQSQFGDTQDHLISIYTFQNGGVPSRYLLRNAPVAEAREITTRDYRPNGCTPLFDAVGTTLTDLEAIAETHDDAVASVTIITDGMENASKRYTGPDVAKLISRLKEKGWNFNLIGANIDVEELAARINIDNSYTFRQTTEGMKEMSTAFNLSRHTMFSRMHEEENPYTTQEEKRKLRKQRSMSFFKK